MTTRPVALRALDAPPRTQASNYPEPFRSLMQGRVKRPLGDLFGLTHFGVNITCIAPGAVSALRHAHSRQDEFVYVVAGTLTLHTDEGLTLLTAGMCAGFPAGRANGHRLVNSGDTTAIVLEVGDRTAGDSVSYPDEDLVAQRRGARWVFTHKDGTPYA